MLTSPPLRLARGLAHHRRRNHATWPLGLSPSQPKAGAASRLPDGAAARSLRDVGPVVQVEGVSAHGMAVYIPTVMLRGRIWLVVWMDRTPARVRPRE